MNLKQWRNKKISDRKQWREELFRVFRESPLIKYWLDFPKLETVVIPNAPVGKIMWLDSICIDDLKTK